MLLGMVFFLMSTTSNSQQVQAERKKFRPEPQGRSNAKDPRATTADGTRQQARSAEIALTDNPILPSQRARMEIGDWA